MLRLLTTLKKRFKLNRDLMSRFDVSRGSAYNKEVQQVQGFANIVDLSFVKRLTIETEDAIYEYIFPRPEPLDSSAVTARPPYLLRDQRDRSDFVYGMVETVDKHDVGKRRTS